MSAAVRQMALLQTIRDTGGEWSTWRARWLLEGMDAPRRSTARGDLKALYRAGFLTVHGPDNGRYYQLSTKGEGS